VTEGREVSAATGTGLPRNAAAAVAVALATAAGTETGDWRGIREVEENSGNEIFTATRLRGWG